MAESLHNWLPDVIQNVSTWISSSDIDKGARWAGELATQLEETKIGIICLTNDNFSAPWILFEAGALSKTVAQAYVCPFLVDVEPVDITGPLAQFQATRATSREDTLKLVLTINRVLGEEGILESTAERQFNRMWSELATNLARIPLSNTVPPPERPEREILKDILETVRTVERELLGPVTTDENEISVNRLVAQNTDLLASNAGLRIGIDRADKQLTHFMSMAKSLEARMAMFSEQVQQRQSR